MARPELSLSDPSHRAGLPALNEAEEGNTQAQHLPVALKLRVKLKTEQENDVNTENMTPFTWRSAAQLPQSKNEV